MKVLYVCSELFPLLKTGGLADVSAGLPPALKSQGCDVRLLMPGFAALTGALFDAYSLTALPTGPTPWGGSPDLPVMGLKQAKLPDSGLLIYLLHAPSLYDRPGDPYSAPDGRDWPDNLQRFAALGWAAACIGRGVDRDWIPDVLHCHDWHAALAPAYVRAFASGPGHVPATVFTIHNLAFQGLFPGHDYPRLGLPPEWFGPKGLEFYGGVSFMKAGLLFADRITTVSPTYAREILTPEQGCALDGVLRERSTVVSVILNGVDYDVWNPSADDWLPRRFDRQSLPDKVASRTALQDLFGLRHRRDALVFGVGSRLTEQKGLHLLVQVLDELVARGGQLAVLGNGDAALEQTLRQAMSRHPGQVGAHIGYDEALAHVLVAGSDVIVLPSAFEPCGLTQLYGLRYGALPLVRAVGGLADTVVDCTPESLANGTATGFVFRSFDADALSSALQRAFDLHKRKDQWAAVQRHAMSLRFDWASAARQYHTLYRQLAVTANVMA